MNRLRLDPGLLPEPDPAPRRSGCALALVLGALAWLAVLVVFALGFLVGAHSVTGHSSAVYARVDDERLAPWPTSRSEPTATLGVVTVLVPTETPSAPSRRPAPTRRPTFVPLTTGRATWYCLAGVSRCQKAHPDGGPYAAAGPDLRAALGPSWRGSLVRVCSQAGVCVRIRLTDWCLCGDDRVVDLYASEFARLAPLGRGVIFVTVDLVER